MSSQETMKLVILSGSQADEVIDIVPPGISIGREQDNDVVLEDGQTSRYHAKIELTDGIWHLVDQNSLNGVRLNRARIKGSAPLSIEDIVQIGDTELMFCDSSGADAFLKARHAPAPTPEQAGDAAGGARATDHGRRRRRLLAVLLGLLLTAVTLAALLLAPERTKPAPPPTLPLTALRIYYEKLQAAEDTVFRYELDIRSGKLKVTVDDLGNRRHVVESKDLAEEQLKELKTTLLTKSFLALVAGQPQTIRNRIDRTRLLVYLGRHGNDVDIVNDIHPPAFAEAVEALESFAEETFGFIAIPLTRDAILQRAEERFAFAERAFAERDVEPANLYQAHEAYRYVVEYLTGLEDKPEIYEKAFARQQETWDMLGEQLRNHEFNGRLHKKMGEYDAARAEFQQILDKMPTPHNEFVKRAREQMHDISRKLEELKREKKKRGSRR